MEEKARFNLEDMPSLNDVLTSAAQKGFYINTENPGFFYKFTGFGSLRCPARVYNSEGNLVRNELLCVDGATERAMFELVSEEQLPIRLRRKSKQGVLKSTPPLCAESKRDMSGYRGNPFNIQ